MKFENQVTSLEPSKRLKELGVPQESLFHWIERRFRLPVTGENPKIGIITVGDFNRTVDGKEVDDTLLASAFTVAELGEMLPKKIQRPNAGKDADWFYLEYSDAGFSLRYLHTFVQYNEEQQEYLSKGKKEAYTTADTEADVRAKMLIYLLENKLISSFMGER